MEGGWVDLVRSLADMLVHDGKYRIHLAEGLHDCCAIRGFLRCRTFVYWFWMSEEERQTYKFATDSGIQIVNGTFIRVCSHRSFRGLVRGAVEDIDGICQTALCCGHGFAASRQTGKPGRKHRWVRTHLASRLSSPCPPSATPDTPSRTCSREKHH